MFKVPSISLRTLLVATLLSAIGFSLHTQLELNIFWSLCVLLALQAAIDAFRVCWTREGNSQGLKRSLLRLVTSAEFVTTLILSLFILQFLALQIFQSVYDVQSVRDARWSDSFNEEGISMLIFELGWLGLLTSMDASFAQRNRYKGSWASNTSTFFVVAVGVILAANYTLIWQLTTFAIQGLENTRPLLNLPQSTDEMVSATRAWRYISYISLIPVTLLPLSLMAWRDIEAGCKCSVSTIWLIFVCVVNMTVTLWIYLFGLTATSDIWQGEIPILRFHSYLAATTIAALVSFVLVEVKLRSVRSTRQTEHSEFRVWSRSGPWTMLAVLCVTIWIVLPLRHYFRAEGMTHESITALIDEPGSALLYVRIAIAISLLQHVFMRGETRFLLSDPTPVGNRAVLGYGALFFGSICCAIPSLMWFSVSLLPSGLLNRFFTSSSP